MRAKNVTHHVQTVDGADAAGAILVGSAHRVRSHGHSGHNMVRQTARARENRKNTVRRGRTQQTL